MNGLTAEQLREFRDALERRRHELAAEIQARLADASSERVASDAVASTAGGDEAALEGARDIDIAVVKRDTVELQEVEASQRRIAQGSYGSCVDCGEQIGIQRLKAFPTALRCASCQSEFEGRGVRGIKSTW